MISWSLILLKLRNFAGAAVEAVRGVFAWLARNPLAMGVVGALVLLWLHAVYMERFEKRIRAETAAETRRIVETEFAEAMAQRLEEIKASSEVEVVRARAIRTPAPKYESTVPAIEPLPEYHYRD